MSEPIWAWFPSKNGLAFGAIPCTASKPTIFPTLADAVIALNATTHNSWSITDDGSLVCASEDELARAEKWFKEQSNA
jgi:hypothetical protein